MRIAGRLASRPVQLAVGIQASAPGSRSRLDASGIWTGWGLMQKTVQLEQRRPKTSQLGMPDPRLARLILEVSTPVSKLLHPGPELLPVLHFFQRFDLSQTLPLHTFQALGSIRFPLPSHHQRGKESGS